ncbi:hypothetical protein Pcinc_007120 [Petrolisthes cinctipes]|nr:hypothetical protein Pcinc_007120 [Petrolisthes cinctipes]
MAPLYTSLAGKPKNLVWGSLQADTFKKAKDSLASAALLVFPAPGSPLIVSTDACNIAIGAVLEQVFHGTRPLSFFSRKLLLAEKNYSTFDRELLAVHQAIRYFHHFLEGVTFTIQTDHMPQAHAFTKQTDAWSPRQRRHLSAISEFNCTFKYLPDKKNPVADALSKVEINAVQIGLDYNHLAREQQQDPEASAPRTLITSLQWRDLPLDDFGTTIL